MADDELPLQSLAIVRLAQHVIAIAAWWITATVMGGERPRLSSDEALKRPHDGDVRLAERGQDPLAITWRSTEQKQGDLAPVDVTSVRRQAYALLVDSGEVEVVVVRGDDEWPEDARQSLRLG